MVVDMFSISTRNASFPAQGKVNTVPRRKNEKLQPDIGKGWEDC
jgi:hypothetical protein